MIIVTGASGFIGSCLVSKLNELDLGRKIIVVDDFYKEYKDANLDQKIIREWIHRDLFIKWFEKSSAVVDFVFHLGARTDTTSKDKKAFKALNLEYSKDIWNLCAQHAIPLVYASSAATYGDGDHGFDDVHKKIKQYKPLNAYAQSKQDFDLWALQQKQKPPLWIGLKFFNVYGPNEYHKGRMASVIFHAYNQIKETGKLKLFKSHKKGFEDGHQMRDFIYVKDVVNTCAYFLDHQKVPSGIYNLGTGKAQSFLDLAHATFKAMGVKPNIEFIPTPKDIRNKYQYFTEAQMGKLRKAGYKSRFKVLNTGVKDYVQNYLDTNSYY